MARPVRIERPGAWYHVTARGNERRAIYRDDRDRQQFCELLAQAVTNFRWVLHTAFRDRYGDGGRDLGRKACGLKLRELAQAAGGLDYTSVAAPVKRFERRVFKVPRLSRLRKQAQSALDRPGQMSNVNVEM